MATFAVKKMNVVPGPIILGNKEKGALCIASFVDGDNTVMLLLPEDCLDKFWCCSLPTANLVEDPKTITYEASGSFSID
jgi:hypothetical protein